MTNAARNKMPGRKNLSGTDTELRYVTAIRIKARIKKIPI